MDTVNLSRGVEQAWTGFVTFMPKLLLAVVILVVGYFIAKLLAGLLDKLLERVGFDRLVERGGIKRALAKTKYDASNLLSKLVFYTIFLFVLEFAFGIFGPNPISAMLFAVIAFLPNLFAAVVIVIVASAIAAAVKDILQATMAGLSYGRTVANITAIAILATGIFAALNQINIAPAIVNGLFYAMLAIVAGSAIVAIGGGGIVPMRSQWEKALGRMEREAPQLKQRMQEMPQRGEERADVWKQQATREPGSEKSFLG